MKNTFFAYILSLTIAMTTHAVSATEATTAEIQTNLGTFVIELNYAKAPKSVENFVRYAQDGFYDDTIFHRVITGFMVQGGGYTEDFRRKPTADPIPNEADNGLKNTAGTVAMARTSDPNSATSQFFINVADNNFLDYRAPTLVGWGYTVFGKIVSGMDVIKSIERQPTGGLGPFKKDVPLDTIIIEKVTLNNLSTALKDALAGKAVATPPPAEADEASTDEATETDAALDDDMTDNETTDATLAAETVTEEDTELAADSALDTDSTTTRDSAEKDAANAALKTASAEAVPAPDSPTQPDKPEPPMQ